MYSILYFSPTGNARHLARELALRLGKSAREAQALEFSDPDKLEKNEQLVLLYPVHSFNAPRTVKRFVRKLPSGLYEEVHLIAVGSAGNWFNDAVSSDLSRVLRKKGYSIGVDEHLAMPLTLVMNFPDEMNLKLIAEAEIRITELGAKIRERKPGERKTEKRKVAFKSRLVNFFGKAESPAARLFGLELHANNDCTSCGTCWENCPEGNIREKSNGKPGFSFSCSMCMRCIYTCPEQAISPRVSKFIPIKGGYALSNYLQKS